MWHIRRQCRQRILPGQRPLSDHQTILCSGNQEVASCHTLLQRFHCPGNLLILWYLNKRHCHYHYSFKNYHCLGRLWKQTKCTMCFSCVRLVFVFLFLVDCPACQFCFPGTDIHSDRSTFWRVSEPDPQPMDVWTTIHLLQVCTRPSWKV